MFNNPYVNAFLAGLYIAVPASILYYAGEYVGRVSGPLGPIAFLALFVLSAAIMGFLFVSQPLRLFLEGNKTEAFAFFSKTVGAFAVITLVFILAVFFTSNS